MSYDPQFTISPRLLSLVEEIAALRERIQGAAVAVSWVAVGPALTSPGLRLGLRGLL